MAWTAPSVAQFKAYFNRDFNYAPQSDSSNLDYIVDSDISKAISEANGYFNPSLGYGTEEATLAAFMYLAAFYLVWNIQNGMKGIGSQFNFPISSKSAGSVSVSYQVPEKFAKDPNLSMFTSNGYGVKFLSLSLPLTVGGGAGKICGRTTWG